MRRRNHPRRRSRLPVVAAVILVFLLGSLVVPAGSFSTAGVTRGSTLDVVSDSEGSLTLDAAQSVTVGQTDRLVTVTNNLGTDVTIAVRLRSDSTEHGDLVVDGVTHGDRASFSLAAGSTQSVDVNVTSDQTLDGERIYFHVNASGTGLTAEAPDRYTSITT